MLNLSRKILFGNDAKLDFRKPGVGVARLSEEPISPDDPYWAQYWLLFDSPSDILTLIQPSDIRSAVKSHPENICTLVTLLAEHLFALVVDPDFGAPSSSGTGVGSLFGGAAGGAVGRPNLVREALNCIRVLSRVIPFVLEGQDEGVSENGNEGGSGGETPGVDSFQEALLWKRIRVSKRRQQGDGVVEDEEAGQGGQFVIDDEEEDEDEDGAGKGKAGANGANGENDGEEEMIELPSLAERLMTAVVDLLFVAGFTVPAEVARRGEPRISYIIWDIGIGSTQSLGSTRELDSNKCEVLRLLLVLLSSSIYVPSHLYPVTPNRFLDLLLRRSGTERKVVLCLLCSLVNTALKKDDAGSLLSGGGGGSAGGGGGGMGIVSGIGGVLGGNVDKYVLRREDVKATLVTLCLQVLDVVLVGQSTSLSPSASTSGGHLGGDKVSAPSSPVVTPHREVPVSPLTHPRLISRHSNDSITSLSLPPSISFSNPSQNAFKLYLSKLHRSADFTILMEGIFSILSNEVQNYGGILNSVPVPVVIPGQTMGKGPVLVAEVLVLFWKLIECNPKFLAFIQETDRAPEIIVYLLFFCLEHKDDPAHLGLIRLCAFILHSVSAERGFGSKLNGPLSNTKVPLPSKYHASGTTADFMISSIYTLIFSTKGVLNSIYPAFVLAIANVSPYIKGLSVVSSTRLLQLFLAFSAPSFILAEEGNPRLVYYLLESFNNIIHFQMSDNPNLIYSICRSHRRFEDLANFTLAAGVADIKRMKDERSQQQQHARQSSTTNLSSSDDTSSPLVRPDALAKERRFSTTSLSSALEGSSDAVDEKTALAERDARAAEATGGNPNQGTSSPNPTATTSPGEGEPVVRQSEKARGKMRERSPSLVLAEENEEIEAWARKIGKNGFVPTEGWVSSWREGLPLDSILLTISELLPKVSALCTSPDSSNTSAIQFLKSATLIGILPPSPPIRPRRFIHSPYSLSWLASFVWGLVFLTSSESFPVWSSSNLKLFVLKTKQRSAPLGLETANNLMKSAMNFRTVTMRQV